MKGEKTAKKNLVKPHKQVREISFQNKYAIQGVFERFISGVLGIDYFSLMIIDSDNTLTCYSSTPALEFNLFEDELWKHDGIFDLTNHISNSFVFWDHLYSEEFRDILITKKQLNFDFHFGFFLMKKIDKLFIIYSFATKSQKNRELYVNSKDTLMNIGDYFFYCAKDIYRKYLPNEITNKSRRENPLKLVVNNLKAKMLTNGRV